jgi:hypothetical protein
MCPISARFLETSPKSPPQKRQQSSQDKWFQPNHLSWQAERFVHIDANGFAVVTRCGQVGEEVFAKFVTVWDQADINRIVIRFRLEKAITQVEGAQEERPDAAQVLGCRFGIAELDAAGIRRDFRQSSGGFGVGTPGW